MAGPDEAAVQRRAKELWEAAGYTETAQVIPVTNPRGPLPQVGILLSPERRKQFIEQARIELRQRGGNA